MDQIQQTQILLINNHPKCQISLSSLKNKIQNILDLLELSNSSLEVTFCDDAFMQEQNKEHRNIDSTTDVLSFPWHEKKAKQSDYNGEFLGAILISLDRAQEQADQQEISLEDESLFLTLHSILHLLGHDHAEEDERLAMQELESQIWLALKKEVKS